MKVSKNKEMLVGVTAMKEASLVFYIGHAYS